VFASCYTLVSCLPYSSTPKMEATLSSETSVNFQRTTRGCISEDSNLHSLCLRGSRVSRVADLHTFINNLTSRDSKPHGCVILTLWDGQWSFLPSSVAI
jgi:hypothetical protein